MRTTKDRQGRAIAPLGAIWQGLRGPRKPLSPRDRREVLNQLFFDGDRRLPYLFRFFTLLSLSVAIASFGLLADSTAVVIGAMLVAPLMTPIQAASASLVMGWERRQLQSLGLVACAVGWSLALSFVFGLIAPDRVTLPGEILSRTEPTLFDLAVALAAGAAGAYTLVRKESSAIPGVAVAVALVPPLSVVGLTLENDQARLALGALLLFATNLAAIILAASLVLIITGFTPRKVATQYRSRIHRGLVVSVLAVVVVAIPLGIHSERVVQETRERHAVEQAVDAWIAAGDEGFDVMSIDIEGHAIEIDIVGPSEPPGTILLNQMIADQIGDDAQVTVRWMLRNEIRMR